MAQLHELARPNKIFRDRTTGKTDKPCPKKVASKKDLVGKDQRGLRERSPAVDVRVMASGVEGAERSGGLHKRSAEDWGASCARQGRSPSGGLVTLLGAERGKAFRVGVAGGKCPQRRLTEDGGCYAGSSQGGDILPLLG